MRPVQVTLNMLLAAIAEYRTENRISDREELLLGGVSLFCEGLAGDPLPQDHLIVCGAEDLRALRTRRGGAVVCVCREEESAPAETEPGLIVVYAGVPPVEVYRKLNARFFDIMDWRMKMAEAMNGGCSLQEIMEMSKDMIGNYIAVSDSTFRLVANTANIPCDDAICQRMIENGYHPESVVAKFRSTGRVKFWEEHDFYIDNGHLFSPYTLVGRIFRMKGEYVAHAVMTCNNREATADVIDLYNVLCEFIARFAARDWENQSAEAVIYSSLLTDLLSEGETDYDAISVRLRQNGFPDGAYCLARVPVNTVANTLVGRLSKDSCEMFSHVQITLCQQELVLLVGAETSESGYAHCDREAERFFRLLEQYELCCGVSAHFDEISEIKLAYCQAGDALNCGERLRRSAHIERVRTGYANVFFYNEYLSYCLLDRSYEVMRRWQTGAAGKSLARIEELDRKNGTNNLQLLFTYLMNERRAKETGEAMHLHRNSVVYRIERLCEAAGLGDLDDPNVRTGLLMSLLMYNLCGNDE